MTRVIDRARNAVARDAQEFVLIAVSGGADSLALAVAASQLRGRLRVGAVIVDHQLQEHSAQVASTAAEQCRTLGLDPVVVKTVNTDATEAAARTARYEAFEQALVQTGATQIMLAHTRDDQAEQVLLGILRGSGTRSLAGIPRARGPYVRPLLELSREDTEQICRGAGLEFWVDPSNADTGYRRNQVRHQILPFLREQLGAHLPEALARTAQRAAEDANALDQWAQKVWEQSGQSVNLNTLGPLPPAISSRVLRIAAEKAGAVNLGSERTAALCALAGIGQEKSKSAGPVQLDGKISAWRKRSVIVFTTSH